MIRDDFLYKRRNKIILEHDKLIKKYSLKRSVIGLIEVKSKLPTYETSKKEMIISETPEPKKNWLELATETTTLEEEYLTMKQLKKVSKVTKLVMKL